MKLSTLSWDASHFDVDRDVTGDGSGSHVRARLKRPLIVPVPLDRVPVDGRIYVTNTPVLVRIVP